MEADPGITAPKINLFKSTSFYTNELKHALELDKPSVNICVDEKNLLVVIKI